MPIIFHLLFFCRSNDEFYLLSTQEQCESLEKCALYSLALLSARLDSCATGFEQLSTSAGYCDMNAFHEKFDRVIADSKVNKMTIMDCYYSFESLAGPSTMKRYAILSNRLSAFVSDKETYKLIALILMLEGCPSHLRKLQNKYLLLLHRRMRQDVNEDAPKEDFFENFKSGLSDIKELSGILFQILAPQS